MPSFRPTCAHISHAALRHNLQLVRRQAPEGAGVLAMIKADAYGHGAAQIASWLEAEGVAALGVISTEEGVELRRHGIRAPIVVLGGLLGGQREAATTMLAHDLTCVLHSPDPIPMLAEAAAQRAQPVPVHLKIDTGMTRCGARPELIPRMLDAMDRAPSLQLAGVMTHLAAANEPEYTAQQRAAFVAAAAQIRARITTPLIWHVANSAAVIHNRARRLTEPSLCAPVPLQPGDQVWVRPGIMLYGIAPFTEDEGQLPLQPVMRLTSRIVLLKQVPTDTAVSYGGEWRSSRPSRLATIPVGYADGYPWSARGRAQVLLRGQPVPVVGRITMDLMICDVTDCPDARVGDEVVLLGCDGAASLSAERLAEAAGTIPYEIVCRISKRVPRVYGD